MIDQLTIPQLSLQLPPSTPEGVISLLRNYGLRPNTRKWQDYERAKQVIGRFDFTAQNYQMAVRTAAN